MKLTDLLMATAVAANAIKTNIANLYDAGTAALASGIQSPTTNGNALTHDTVKNLVINDESASSSQRALDRDIPRTGGDLSSAFGDVEIFYDTNDAPEDNYCDEDSELYDCIPHPDDLYDDILSDIPGLFQESTETIANSNAVQQDAKVVYQDMPTELKQIASSGSTVAPDDLDVLSDIDESHDINSFSDDSHVSSTELSKATPSDSKTAADQDASSISQDAVLEQMTALQSTFDQDASDVPSDISLLSHESNDTTSFLDGTFVFQESPTELQKAAPFNSNPTIYRVSRSTSLETLAEPKLKSTLDSTIADEPSDALLDIFRLFDESNDGNSYSDGFSVSHESSTELHDSPPIDLRATGAQDVTSFSQEPSTEHNQPASLDSTAAKNDLDVLSDLYRLFDESNDANSHSDGSFDSQEASTELNNASPFDLKAPDAQDVTFIAPEAPIEHKQTASLDSTAAQDDLDLLSDLYRLFDELNDANSYSDGSFESQEASTELKNASPFYVKAPDAQDVTFIAPEAPIEHKQITSLDSTEDDLEVLSDLYRLFEESNHANSHSDGSFDFQGSSSELKNASPFDLKADLQDETFISQESPIEDKRIAFIDSTAAPDDLDVLSDLYRLFELPNDAKPSSDSVSVSEDSLTQLTAPSSPNIAIPLYSSDTLSDSSTFFTPEQLDLMANWILFMLGPSTKDDNPSSRLSEDNDDLEFFRRLSEFLEDLDDSYFSRELTDEDFDGFLESSPSDLASFATTTSFESFEDFLTGSFSSLKDSGDSSATHNDDAVHLPVEQSTLSKSDSATNSAPDNIANAQYSNNSVNRDFGHSDADVIQHSLSDSISSVTEALVLSSDDGGSSLGYLEPASLPVSSTRVVFDSSSDSAISSSQSSVGNENDNGSHVREERNSDDIQIMTIRGTELETASSNSTDGTSGFSFTRFVSSQKLPIYLALSIILALIVIVVFSRYRKRQKRLAVNEMFASMQIPSRHEVV